jgi:hypothetical protein
MKAGRLGLGPLRGLRPLGFGGLLALVLVLAAGSVRGESTQAEGQQAPQGSQTALVRDLAEKSVATVEDGMRLALLFSQGVGATEPFADVAAKLRGSGLIRDAWLEKPGDPLRKGQLAYIIIKGCAIKGGLTMRLTGVSERYALRECTFLNLLVRGSTGNYVSGLELLGSMGRAEKYLEEHPRTP